MATNVALAQSLPKPLLVVSRDVFMQHDWPALGLTPLWPHSYKLDQQQFEFLLKKPNFDPRELKLLIKIILASSDGEFDPAMCYLTKDEFYLFDQKLSPTAPIKSKVEGKTVTTFLGLWELLELGVPLKSLALLIPQWLEFDEWCIDRSAKVITSAYLNAVVASRRDFIRDQVRDTKVADQLFKQLNELGSHLVMTTAVLGLVWQEQQRNDDTVELEEKFLSTKNGNRLKGNLTGVIDSLLQYRDSIQKLKVALPQVLARQVEHTNSLIQYLKCLTDPTQAYKIYLDGRGERVMLRIIKDPPENIWQTKLKPLTLVIASNGVTVDGASGFASTVLGAPVKVQALPLGKVAPKEIIWITDLPSKNSFNYQREIFRYLKLWIESEAQRALVVMPNIRLLGDFFNECQPHLGTKNILTQDIAGNLELLTEKLAGMDSFIFMVAQYGLSHWVSALPDIDQAVFLRLAFDPPNKTAQLIASLRCRNGFIEYSLPKAVVNLKITLAQLYWRAKEFWILDSRIVSEDYGQVVRRSLAGFKHIDTSRG
ncbi:hypothetical protein A2V68_02790 [candidate division Kazan bacterium RBG_13_50_9]|uniref:ATP-dependent helicase C-terminal domain-containing protein n=1 Tax=candidate division Kazan bacterium RBG_13_50_9 TaxID=1798535 RepID=A0A1F4NSP7_UNCK3|nr:MAG: hypothetical protein A2V68_02790 [candidate division Kazan bacterium RBG_13_50_9]